METTTETSTYEVEFLVHQNEIIRVEATDEDAAYEQAKNLMAAKMTAVEGYRGGDWDNIGIRRITKTSAADIAEALRVYKEAVEHNTNEDYDAIAAVIDDVENHSGCECSYELTESVDAEIDLDDPGVVRAVLAGLRAMVALWKFERGIIS